MKQIITDNPHELKILRVWEKLTPEQKVKILKKEAYIEATAISGKLTTFRFVEEKLIGRD